MQMVERVIPAAQVPVEPVTCPRCKARDITLKGVVTRGFTETCVSVSDHVQTTFAEELEREIDTIECRDCQIRFVIMTEEEYSLAQQNMQLHEALLMFSPNYIKAANSLPC